jgi:DNA-binding SARP family transcriptional activator
MTQTEFLFFGPPRFRVNGTTVKISRRKAFALASYLAATAKPHAREKLAAMLWSNAWQHLKYGFLP